MATPADAARAMAVAEARQRDNIRNPAGYIRAAANRYLTEHETVWHALLQSQPGISVRELVSAVTAARDPLAGEREAREARMAANRRRARGTACPRCDDTGWCLDQGSSDAVRCDVCP